jgi:hypothetical protein
VGEQVGEVLAAAAESFGYWAQELATESFNATKVADGVAETAMELTSTLFIGGAPHPVYRRWAGITAVASWHVGKVAQAAQYSALGNEWALIAALPKGSEARGSFDELVLWRLVGGATPELPASDPEPMHRAWLSLATSIPAGDHPTTAAALDTIASYWIVESDGDWENAHRGFYPDYHLPGCAAGAIARHHGLPKRLVTPETYRFLEAGLADGLPDPLYPGTLGPPG